jgi:glycosyltransferase involved in cell wall biosynthesis
MSSPPQLVSIVLCTYNGESFLAQQMETLLMQTYPRLEIVVCDDASTDDTYSLLQNFAARDQRIRLYRNEHNIGFNKNFEQAIRYATGAWCAISDQDDLWAENKLEKMMRHSANCTLVHCSSNQFSTGKKPSAKPNRHYQKFEGNDARKNFLYNTFEGHCLLFKREVALESMPFPEEVYYDWWLGMNATVRGGVCWIPEVLTFRRLHEHNASEAIYQKEKKENSRLQQALRNIAAFLTVAGMTEEQKAWGEELRQCIQLHLAGNSKPLYEFLIRYRKLIFFYKTNKLLPYISQLKAIKKFIRK